MTANDSKSYPYLNELVDQYNNTYHSIKKKPLSRILKLLNLK